MILCWYNLLTYPSDRALVGRKFQTRTICALAEEDTSLLLLFQIQPNCKKHRHFTKEEAIREISKSRCIWVGSKQVYYTHDNRIVLSIEPNCKSIKALTEQEAKNLCDTGHAERIRYNLIQIIRNIKIGPALSLKIGHT